MNDKAHPRHVGEGATMEKRISMKDEEEFNRCRSGMDGYNTSKYELTKTDMEA